MIVVKDTTNVVKNTMFYQSKRVGKDEKEFLMWKIKTLQDNFDKTNLFTNEEGYTKYGRFLRKTKLDEVLQLWNVLKGEMAFFGPRPIEVKSIRIIPIDIRRKLLSVKPGIVDIASIYFYDEEKILQFTDNPHKEYWKRIAPMKFTLQMFYIDNRCFLLNCAILWIVFKRVLRSLFT